MSTPNNAFATLHADALVTATGGSSTGGSLIGGAYPGGRSLAHLTNLLSNTVNTQAQNQQSQQTQLMTMGMLALALRNR